MLVGPLTHPWSHVAAGRQAASAALHLTVTVGLTGGVSRKIQTLKNPFKSGKKGVGWGVCMCPCFPL